ncbi:molybdenum cofactor guanylyltransferase [Corynebacterium confusum]|uniref:molybdenum cofactor guanylyltransferase n=1 Tax=uncultured Corynebacterium sp. TaxID=159447 RepID=UPI0026008CFA|nr:NTP transferase domain-containing protein [uncultured Corynebacterium sp.]
MAQPAYPLPGPLGALVLAGGRGRRMGGVDKASLRVAGQRLIDRVLGQLPYHCERIVVSPYPLGLPQVCENPLFGGPVAGIARGTQALHSDYIAVLSVDAPNSAQLLPALWRALQAADADAAIVRSADGFLQPLCSLWKADHLRRALGQLPQVHNASARRLLRQARRDSRLIEVPGTGAERDYDTPQELAEFAENVLQQGQHHR